MLKINYLLLGFLISCLLFSSAHAITWLEAPSRSANHNYECGYTQMTDYTNYWGSGTFIPTSAIIGHNIRAARRLDQYDNGYARASGGVYIDSTVKAIRIEFSNNACRLFYSYDYVATPAEPAHCFNGVKDGDEIGQDCGGSCSSLCKNDCPDGMLLMQIGNPADGYIGTCIHIVDPKSGLCPSGYTYYAAESIYDDPAVGGSGRTLNNPARCEKRIDAKLIPMDPADPNQTYGYTDSELQAIANGWDGVNRLTEMESTVTYTETVDPVTGDVTIVRTETTTKTDGNGNTTTKTSVKTTVMDADGKIKSETTQEQSDGLSNDPGDYNFPDGTEGWDDDSWIPEEEDMQGLFDGWWSTSPIGGLYSQSRLEMHNSEPCLFMIIYGKTIPICFNDPALVSGYAVWRGMIISVTYLAGFFYLVRRGG